MGSVVGPLGDTVSYQFGRCHKVWRLREVTDTRATWVFPNNVVDRVEGDTTYYTCGCAFQETTRVLAGGEEYFWDNLELCETHAPLGRTVAALILG